VREVLQFFTREKRWINERHLEICRIPALTFQEQERAGYLAERLVEMGYDAQIDRAGNVVAPLVYERGAPFVALTAHLDTVLAPRAPDEIELRPNGVIAGPGVADNGAGLAALLAVARALKTASPLPDCTHNLLFAANTGEEGEGNLLGMRFLCRQSSFAKRISAFLILDGAAIEHITTRALGSRRFEVAINGPGGHSWSDFGTANPVHALARAVTLFADRPLPEAWRSAINVGVFQGGSTVNAIPAEARAKVDIRSESNEAVDAIVVALEEAVREAVEEENRRATAAWWPRRCARSARGLRPSCRSTRACWPACGRWTRTWASVPTWSGPPPTPTSPYPWDVRRRRLGPAGRAAALTPPPSGSTRRGATSD